jgi:hypothetical protein
MWNFKDKILIEVCAHDHVSDLRSHSSGTLFDVKKKCNYKLDNNGDYFTGKLVTPGVSPVTYSNPGFAVFNYSEEYQLLSDLKLTFLLLD